jgi:dolichol-phosphate mannosyltransferase
MGCPDVSVVFPVRDEAGNIRTLYAKVREALHKAGVSHEMVFVDDGSRDQSLELIKALRVRDPGVHYLSLSRPFGHQAALAAGMDYARGRAVIMMDADLQHPPELIPEMIRRWREGYETVYTIKRNSRMPLLWRWQMRLVYPLLSKLSGLQLSFGQSDFRLLDRKVVDVLRAIPEYRKFLRGLVSWAGFKQVGLEYTVAERAEGTSKYSYRALARLALDGVFAFSVTPLRVLLAFGLIISLITFPYILFVSVLAICRLLGWTIIDLPSGWATVTVAVLWLGSVQLVAIGLVGEYLARTYEQTKGRPVFIVRETSDERRAAKPSPEAWPTREPFDAISSD